jgi:hypothetical protein
VLFPSVCSSCSVQHTHTHTLDLPLPTLPVTKKPSRQSQGQDISRRGVRLEGHTSGEVEEQCATSSSLRGCDGGICGQDFKLHNPPPAPKASREEHPSVVKERVDLPLFSVGTSANFSRTPSLSSGPFDFDPLFESDPPDELIHV